MAKRAEVVGRWRGRFATRGLDGLHDEPRPGEPRSISDADVERVIVKTLEEPLVWHKSADEILDNLAVYCQRISDSGH